MMGNKDRRCLGCEFWERLSEKEQGMFDATFVWGTCHLSCHNECKPSVDWCAGWQKRENEEKCQKETELSNDQFQWSPPSKDQSEWVEQMKLWDELEIMSNRLVAYMHICSISDTVPTNNFVRFDIDTFNKLKGITLNLREKIEELRKSEERTRWI